ncbi:PucR family transcriptional regulator [uncultured Microbacterium sp.]|uniref:PucR family transcriptional regulator n=1 Tax=uncultured Microbacterium sp. TaxID=191216 RepID=UPI0025EFDBBC|nr:PucR family transcriptional regulator [uncultured Microbacterium sp.]
MTDRRDFAALRTDRPGDDADAATLPTVAEVIGFEQLAAGAPEVVVGGPALERRVRWVHVSDSADVARLLDGGELLLTTASGWPDEPERLRALIDELSAAGVSGIVLELGAHYRYLPAVVAEAARACAMPLVVLHREVRFVAVTEAVHRRIIADQTHALRARDAVRSLFTGLALGGAPADYIVEQLGLTLAAPVVLETLAHEVVIAHVGGAVEVETLLGWPARSRSAHRAPDRAGRVIVPVAARGASWGYLVALPGEPHPAGREAVVEQAAIALALGRLADPAGDEWTRLGRRLVVDNLLAGRVTSLAAGAARLDAVGVPVRGAVVHAIVGIVDAGGSGAGASSGAAGAAVAADAAMAIEAAAVAIGARAVCGTPLASSARAGRWRIPVLLAEPADRGNALGAIESLEDALETLGERPGTVSLVVGISVAAGEPGAEASGIVDPTEAHALGAAIEALRATLALAETGDRPSATRARRSADRPLTAVAAALRDDHRVVTHADRMLAPLLADPRGSDGDLLDVLAALVKHPTNRTAAAEASFLSRSVFYQRLALIEDLLGVDLDDGEQLAALHLALLAHRLR